MIALLYLAINGAGGLSLDERIREKARGSVIERFL